MRNVVAAAVLAVVAAFCCRAAQKTDVAREWESSGRPDAMDWFTRNWFGARPVERPADEKVGRDFVSFVGGRKKVRIRLFLPRGASKANPVPVFVHADHFNPAQGGGRTAGLLAVATNTVPRRGYAYVYFNLNDVTPNTWNSANEPNSANVLLGGGGVEGDGWGAVSAWAWGCSRVMDWVESRPELDASRVAIVGNGAGGAAALWAGCTDSRFALTVSGSSGTGGARLLKSQAEGAETLSSMTNHAARLWFCRRLAAEHAGREAEMEHDADDLLRLVAPRCLYVSSASLDAQSGPTGEFEAARLASDMWRAYGERGLELEAMPAPGVWDHSGRVGYHLRPGPGGLAAWDWARYIDYMDRHFPGRDRAPEMATATPESQGVPSAAIGRWLEACGRELDSVHGFVIVRHGKVIAEGSWKPYDTLNRPHMLYSHSKSFTSTAIGFLVDDGKVDLDERVLDIFPDKAPASPSENLKALRVRDLLAMNAGASVANYVDMENDRDWERMFLSRDFPVKPGAEFAYDSMATYMLSCIVSRRSGMGLMDFLKGRLFDRIGIVSVDSSVSPSGTPCGGWGMYMTTRDIARFGQFMLQEGVWNGERLLSQGWVRLATGRQTATGKVLSAREAAASASDWDQGYGFQFWRCRNGAYRAAGSRGQFTIVMPEQDAVVSLNSGLDNMQKALNLVWEYLLPNMGDALPEDPVSVRTLRQCCASLAIPVPEGSGDVPGGFLGRKVTLAKNLRGIKSVTLARDDGGLRIDIEDPAGVSSVPVGLGEWKPGEIRVDDKKYENLGDYIGVRPTAAAAALGADGVFRVRIIVTDAPGRIELDFGENGGAVSVSGKFRFMRGGDLVSARDEERRSLPGGELPDAAGGADGAELLSAH